MDWKTTSVWREILPTFLRKRGAWRHLHFGGKMCKGEGTRGKTVMRYGETRQT